MLLPYCHLKITNRKYIVLQIREFYSDMLGTNGNPINVFLLRRIPTLSYFLEDHTSWKWERNLLTQFTEFISGPPRQGVLTLKPTHPVSGQVCVTQISPIQAESNVFYSAWGQVTSVCRCKVQPLFDSTCLRCECLLWNGQPERFLLISTILGALFLFQYFQFGECLPLKQPLVREGNWGMK